MELILRLPPRAQAIAKNPTAWPMIKIANTKPSLSLSIIKEAVRDSSLPSLHDPETFCQKLFDLETVIGTCPALLIGLLIADGDTAPEKLLSGLDNFEEAKRAIKERIAKYQYLQYQSPDEDLYPWALTDAVYKPLWIKSPSPERINDISLLLRLSKNRNAENAIGRHRGPNCIYSAAMVTLFALSQGLISAEARKYPSIHPFSYFEHMGQGYLFEYNGIWPSTSCADNHEAEKLLTITHPFSLIAAYLTSNATKFVRRKMVLTPDEKEMVREKLACAETINPFHSRIYEMLATVSEQEEACVIYTNYHEALEAYGQHQHAARSRIALAA
ncbi:hypothetical protein COT42_07720 [Candidatus Saganbacteria bacterium CG08_land_8_20_14_0_20_45_16]|uniref:Uncharacterized protein n=1 Tax=Candidatus Saganbacteria bacterium CG08_land_8_20_14_0_20_45_16 TaxID=2014293 RepID=A0A2H0XUJ5_UNCSA|nr:MAG: hypothetical protein COT42_07720 [Candidatus Saganbacteria bacterium CG08_land_8_20_14_0_20_45_16]